MSLKSLNFKAFATLHYGHLYGWGGTLSDRPVPTLSGRSGDPFSDGLRTDRADLAMGTGGSSHS